MNKIRVSTNFYAHELLAPEYFTPGLDPTWYITEFLYKVPQQLRDHFGKTVTINNWADGGSFKYRGFRPFGCGVGAEKGMHYIGLAIDINIDGLTQEEILNEVVKNRQKFPLLTSYEDLGFTKGWNHFDGRNIVYKENLFCVKPR